MSFLDQLSFGFGRRLPLLLQTEATECGLACLGMVAGFHGYRADLASLRKDFPVSLKGATLGQLMDIAAQLRLAARPLKLELGNLAQLQLPCILHWEFNHFVVLKEVSDKGATICDPAVGVRHLSWEAISRSFTGVALELWPDTGFTPQEKKQVVHLRDLIGRVHGLMPAFGQVMALALALEVFALLNPFFLQWVIDDVLVSADRSLLSMLALGFGLMLFMEQGINAIRTWLLLCIGTKLNVQWRANLFSHLIRLPVPFFEKRHLGDVVSRFGAINHIQRTLTTSFMEALLDGLMTLITVAMMFIYSATLASVAIVAMLLYALARWLCYRPLFHATEEHIVFAAKQETHFLETVRGVRAIKLFQRQDERRAAWLTLLVDEINADLRIQKMQMIYKVFNRMLFGAEHILIIWLGAKLALDGIFTVGALIAFNAYKDQFNSRVASLIDKLYEVWMLRLQGERLADIALTAPESIGTPGAGLPRDELDASIEVVDVHFRYGDSEPPVLDGVTFKVHAGESVAIVGPSGCGKSTLMNVLLGILPPSSGMVRVGGVDVSRIGLDSLRGMIGTVMQDDVLFAGSIADNISFFDPRADMDWVMQCAETAAVAADIDTMPMGYNTLVGDMGTVLSGGQKQRVLLARALYKRPRILFLDEATSHLDGDREREVNASVRALNITRIIIAHRAETIASADRVVRLDQGIIVHDTGTRTPSDAIVQALA